MSDTGPYTCTPSGLGQSECIIIMHFVLDAGRNADGQLSSYCVMRLNTISLYGRMDPLRAIECAKMAIETPFDCAFREVDFGMCSNGSRTDRYFLSMGNRKDVYDIIFNVIFIKIQDWIYQISFFLLIKEKCFVVVVPIWMLLFAIEVTMYRIFPLLISFIWKFFQTLYRNISTPIYGKASRFRISSENKYFIRSIRCGCSVWLSLMARLDGRSRCYLAGKSFSCFQNDLVKSSYSSRDPATVSLSLCFFFFILVFFLSSASLFLQTVSRL